MLDIGIIATLDPLGHPDRLPTDTVIWPCGAYGWTPTDARAATRL